MRRLIDSLFPPRADEKLVRDTTPEQLLEHLVPRCVSATRPAAVSLLPFSEKIVRATLHEAKYHGARHAHRLLSEVFAEYLRDADLSDGKIIIVPIPLGATRRKERGFNQAEEVCRGALARLKKAGDTSYHLDGAVLRRTRETVSQVSLPRAERERNMRDSFSALRSIDPVNLYLVVDDVLTTGATLQAAVDALADAGATRIIPLAFAH